MYESILLLIKNIGNFLAVHKSWLSQTNAMFGTTPQTVSVIDIDVNGNQIAKTIQNISLSSTAFNNSLMPPANVVENSLAGATISVSTSAQLATALSNVSNKTLKGMYEIILTSGDYYLPNTLNINNVGSKESYLIIRGETLDSTLVRLHKTQTGAATNDSLFDISNSVVRLANITMDGVAGATSFGTSFNLPYSRNSVALAPGTTLLNIRNRSTLLSADSMLVFGTSKVGMDVSGFSTADISGSLTASGVLKTSYGINVYGALFEAPKLSISMTSGARLNADYAVFSDGSPLNTAANVASTITMVGNDSDITLKNAHVINTRYGLVSDNTKMDLTNLSLFSKWFPVEATGRSRLIANSASITLADGNTTTLGGPGGILVEFGSSITCENATIKGYSSSLALQNNSDASGDSLYLGQGGLSFNLMLAYSCDGRLSNLTSDTLYDNTASNFYHHVLISDKSSLIVNTANLINGDVSSSNNIVSTNGSMCYFTGLTVNLPTTTYHQNNIGCTMFIPTPFVYAGLKNIYSSDLLPTTGPSIPYLP